MSRRWIWWSLALLVVLGGIAGALWMATAKPSVPVGQLFKLPDGSVVRLERVTYGIIHAPEATPWQQMLARLPAKLTRMLRLNNPAVHKTKSPELIAWFSGGNNSSFEVTVSDTQRRNAVRTYNSAYIQPRPGVQFKGFNFRAFPRRERELLMSVSAWGNKGRESLGEWRCPNPTYSTAKPWTAPPLPLSATNGELTLTLTNLFTGAEMSSSTPKPARRVDEGAAWLAYEVAERGKPTTEFKFLAARMEDATGNDVNQSSWSDDANRGTVSFTPLLWPGEAWKLQLTLARRTNFARHELAGPVKIAVITPTNSWEIWKNTNSITRVDWGTNQLEVIAWSRAGGGSPDTRLGVRMAALSDDTFVDIVSAVTETGTNLVRSSWSNGGTTREFGLNTAAQTLNLTLSLTPRRRFELLAEPTPLTKPPEK
jgi:hypothetical protein